MLKPKLGSKGLQSIKQDLYQTRILIAIVTSVMGERVGRELTRSTGSTSTLIQVRMRRGGKRNPSKSQGDSPQCQVMNSSLILKKRGERENIEDTGIIAIQDQILVIMILQAMMMKLSRGEADQSITNDDDNQNLVRQILQAMKTMVLSGGELIQSTTNATIAGLSHMIQVPQAMNKGLVMQSIISVIKDHIAWIQDHIAWIQGRRILMGLGMTEGADL